MIEVENLAVTYGRDVALEGINLNVEKNTSCAVIGPSGCGKTTLLYTLAGLLSPDRGEVRINGRQQVGLRKETGVIMQDYGLLPWKTVRENVALGLKVRNESREYIQTTVMDILEELGIEGLMDKYPAELSGGQRQRVAVGRALAVKPDLLLMDEPSSALDAITKEHIQNLILKIYKYKPLTFMLVTHNIAEAVFLGQKIVVMGKARINHVLDNPYFGDEELREKMEFYQICLEVRKWMDSN